MATPNCVGEGVRLLERKDVGRGVAARFDGNESGHSPSHFHDRARSDQYDLRLVQSVDPVHSMGGHHEQSVVIYQYIAK